MRIYPPVVRMHKTNTMKTRSIKNWVTGSLLALISPSFASPAAKDAQATVSQDGSVDSIITAWPERPRLGARQMIAKYGAPQEVTSGQLVWHDQGPFKCITVTKMEDAHDFPLPHTDYMQHTITYKVPDGKADELAKFDGSLTYDQTRGLMSARCDLEGHNILTLNLANDIVTGKKSADAARKEFGDIVADDMAGKMPAYVVKLQFEPDPTAKDSDKPTMAGAPVRAMKAPQDDDKEVKAVINSAGDAEVLSLLIAVNTNEIVAAMEVANKKVSPEIQELATMMHKEHGKNSGDTMDLAKKLDIIPSDTEKTDELRKKGAAELAGLLAMDDEAFGGAYVDAMVKGHKEVLALIDKELMKSAENDSVKKHLAATREVISMHLEHAKGVQEKSSTENAGQPAVNDAAGSAAKP